MIVTSYSITAFTVDALSLGLATATFAKTSQILLKFNIHTQESGEAVTHREGQLYLVFWAGVVLLTMRLISWPLFYLALESFILEISGAMCIFGTTKLLPGLTSFLEIVKPVYFFICLVWVILFKLERFGNKAGNRWSSGWRTVGFLLLLCTLLSAIDAGGSLILWANSSAELSVSCCTTITDIPKRFTVWVPRALLGPGYIQSFWYIYFCTNVVTIVLGALSFRSWQKNYYLPFLLFFCGAIALANSIITLVAFIELIAPKLMGLAFHHCLYCFIQTVMDAPLILGLMITGSFSLMACFPVWLLAKWADQQTLRKTMLALQATGMVCLTGSLLMVTVHLITI